MRVRRLLLSLCFVLAANLFAHKIPDSAWQKGTLKDIRLEQEASVSGAINQGNGTVHGGTYTVRHFTVETTEMVYEVIPLNGVTRISLEKGRLDFTVNSTYLFAVEKAEMIIRDVNGKEGKFRIVKKTLKETTPRTAEPN